MTSQTIRRRFIAGATCPQCGETDKIFTQVRMQKNQEGANPGEAGVAEKERGCVACDFIEVLSDLEEVAQEPVVVGDWSPVKLMD